jgi:hypothetical protein
MEDNDEPRRYLDEPFALEIILLQQAQDLLRQLAQNNSRPARMRTATARMYQRLGAFRRELRRRYRPGR